MAERFHAQFTEPNVGLRDFKRRRPQLTIILTYY